MKSLIVATIAIGFLLVLSPLSRVYAAAGEHICTVKAIVANIHAPYQCKDDQFTEDWGYGKKYWFKVTAICGAGNVEREYAATSGYEEPRDLLYSHLLAALLSGNQVQFVTTSPCGSDYSFGQVILLAE